MKQAPNEAFGQYLMQLSEKDAALLREYFAAFDARCLVRSAEKNKLRQDLEQALLYYTDEGLPLKQALTLLDIRHFGDFYAQPPTDWFSLDDAAKIYPVSMKHGRMAVFRLSACLKKNVVPELLQMALNFTIKRFPSFTTTLKKGFFWHYLDTPKCRFRIQPDRSIPCQPLRISRSGSPSFRVLYYRSRISVEFFHVLTDGTGGMVFLKALTAEYLRLTGLDIPPDETLWDVDRAPSAEELENAFVKVPQSSASSGFVDKAAVQMRGQLSKNRPCRVVHFKMDAAELKAAAEKHGATVTVYLLALMFLAGKTAIDAHSGEASIQVPVNMRKFYPSQTVRNFAMYCGIRIPVDAEHHLASLIPEITRQLKEKASMGAMREMLTATVRLVHSIRFIPLVIKQPIANMIYGFLGDKIFTNTLSNLGIVSLPREVSAQIESMDFVLGTAITNRASCAVVTASGVATFSITKMTADPTFEEKMYELLLADGISVTAKGSELHEN